MLKANKKTLIIASIITILPMLIGVFLWNRLPDRMASFHREWYLEIGNKYSPYSDFGHNSFTISSFTILNGI